MPQHWVDVVVGFILIVAGLIDIWVRQANICSTFRTVIFRPKQKAETAHA
jgi:hypothetical protein